MLLSELLSADRIKVPLGGLTKDELLRELVDLVAPTADPAAKHAILAAVQEREQLLSTGIGAGVAIPHGKTPVVDQLLMAAGVTSRPVDFDALDGQPVELFFLLVGPESASGAIALGAETAREFRENIQAPFFRYLARTDRAGYGEEFATCTRGAWGVLTRDLISRRDAFRLESGGYSGDGPLEVAIAELPLSPLLVPEHERRTPVIVAQQVFSEVEPGAEEPPGSQLGIGESHPVQPNDHDGDIVVRVVRDHEGRVVLQLRAQRGRADRQHVRALRQLALEEVARGRG